MNRKKPFWKKILISAWIVLLLIEAVQLLRGKEVPTYAGGEPQMEALLAALENNPELKEFVEGFPQAEPIATGGFTREELEADFPLLLQWDKRWGYVPYGKNNIGIAGCGPTCLSMVVLALTGNEEATPDAIAAYSLENGYYVNGEGTSWSLMTEGAEDFNLQAWEVSLDERTMKEYLDRGNPIICAMRKGDFTTSGHFIVIYGYNEEGFWVNDPNSVIRSEKQWDFDTLKIQIRNMWAYDCI